MGKVRDGGMNEGKGRIGREKDNDGKSRKYKREKNKR